jgi:hypothetical protein
MSSAFPLDVLGTVADESRDMLWDKWVRDSTSPSRSNESIYIDLDHKLGRLVIGDAEHLVIPNLTRAQRFWVHARASQLKLASATTSNMLRVTKPADWSMDWAPSKARILSKKTARRTACDVCGDTLEARQALYNWRGVGPLCETCVNADPELAGWKWEVLDY